MLRIPSLLAIVCMMSIVFSAHHKTDSPLTKLMRTMAADMKKARLEIIAGKKISNFGKHYTKINSAKPSSESKKRRAVHRILKVIFGTNGTIQKRSLRKC